MRLRSQTNRNVVHAVAAYLLINSLKVIKDRLVQRDKREVTYRQIKLVTLATFFFYIQRQ